MYSNWGPAIQIKHLSLDITLAKNIVNNVILKQAADKVSSLDTIQQTSEFNYIKGDLSFSGGYANLDKILMQGPKMAYYITGKFNLFIDSFITFSANFVNWPYSILSNSDFLYFGDIRLFVITSLNTRKYLASGFLKRVSLSTEINNCSFVNGFIFIKFTSVTFIYNILNYKQFLPCFIFNINVEW